MRFLCASLSSHGFVFPLVGLGQRLIERGHEVALATGPELAETIAGAGLERIPRGAKDGPSFDTPIWAQPLAVAIQIKHLQYAIDRFRPDALISTQLTLGPLLVSEKLRIPISVLALMTYLWPFERRLLDGPATSELESLTVWRHQSMLGSYNQCRKLLRLPQDESSFLESPLLGDLFMLRSIVELESDIERYPQRVHLVGPCLWQPDGPADPELQAFLAQAEKESAPIIYVQPGSSFDLPRFFPKLIDAIGARDLRVVAAVGRMHGEVGALPRNILARPHIDQDHVLPHARAMISAGNTTATLAALRRGLPMLLFPGGGEQVDVTDRCVRAGAAIRRDLDDLSEETLLAALDELLERADLVQASDHLRRAFKQVGDGFDLAADRVELLAEARQPILRSQPSDATGIEVAVAG